VFDLGQAGLDEILGLSAAVMEPGAKPASLQAAARDLLERLCAPTARDGSTAPAVVSAQCFLVRRFDDLAGEVQDVVRASANSTVYRLQPCAVLLAARDVAQVERRSHRIVAAPVASQALAAMAPTLPGVLAAVLSDGAAADHGGPPSDVNLVGLERWSYAIGHEGDARDSKLFAEWAGFTATRDIHDVLTIAAVLPTGTLVFVLYMTVALSRETAEAFAAVAVAIKIAMLPYTTGRVLDGEQPVEPPVTEAPGDVRLINAQNEALSELVRVQHDLARSESRRLREALAVAGQRGVDLAASQSALAGTRARAEAIFNAALDAVVVMDSTGCIVEWNPAAEATFGWSKSEALGKRVSELIVPPRFREQHEAGLARYLSGGEGRMLHRRVELDAVRRDGTLFPIELAISEVDAPGSLPLFTGFIRDITNRKSDEAALLASRERFAQIARTLQRSLLPAELPSIDGLDLASVYQPSRAWSDVGGDFYDVFPIDRHEQFVMLGDVCGKGAEAAALTSIARYTVRAVASHIRHPAQVLRRVNTALNDQDIGERFCSMVAARVTPIVRGVRLTVCCAGHAAPVVVRAGGSVERVGVSGDLLGLFDDVKLFEETVQLTTGDTIVFFTDGVTEATRGDDQFGEQRAEAALVAASAASASDMVKGLLDAALEFGGEDSRDDIAILALQVKPS
jgi:PAS domain S-box-containing protein